MATPLAGTLQCRPHCCHTGSPKLLLTECNTGARYYRSASLLGEIWWVKHSVKQSFNSKARWDPGSQWDLRHPASTLAFVALTFPARREMDMWCTLVTSLCTKTVLVVLVGRQQGKSDTPPQGNHRTRVEQATPSQHWFTSHHYCCMSFCFLGNKVTCMPLQSVTHRIKNQCNSPSI